MRYTMRLLAQLAHPIESATKSHLPNIGGNSGCSQPSHAPMVGGASSFKFCAENSLKSLKNFPRSRAPMLTVGSTIQRPRSSPNAGAWEGWELLIFSWGHSSNSSPHQPFACEDDVMERRSKILVSCGGIGSRRNTIVLTS